MPRTLLLPSLRRLLVLPFTFVLGAGALSAPAAGQEPPEQGGRERIVREMIEKRRLMREGKVVRTSVHVTVRLNNGNRISGVLKNGRFIEQLDGLEFIESDVVHEGAGLRVWYYDRTNSYIFLPFTDIRSYRIGARLTEHQVKAMEERLEKERREIERRRQEESARRAAETAEGGAAQGEEGSAPAAPGGAAEREQREQQQAKQREEEAELLKLLDEFPPDQGWGEEKLAEIHRQRVVIGRFDAKSQRFVEVFEQWRKANELKQRRQQEEEAKKGGGGAGTGGGGGDGAKPGANGGNGPAKEAGGAGGANGEGTFAG